MLKLNEVSEIIMGQSPSSATYNTAGEGLPFFQGNADFGDEHPNVRMFCSIPIKIAEVNDVLLSVRAPIGAVNVADKKCCIGRGLAAIRPQKGKSITRYLFHLLIANRGSLENKGTGSTFKAITGKVLNSVKVPHENVDEQKAIADILDKIVATIRKRRVQVSLCDDLVKSQFIEMFGDPFTTTEWDKKPLREVSVSIYDGSNIPKDLYCSTGSIVFYRIQNVWRNEYHLDDLVYISSGTSRIYSDSSLNTNDILITKIGRFYTKDSSLGRVALYKGETGKAHFSNNIMRIRLKAEVKGEYINALLNLDVYQAYIKKVSVGGTDKRALSKMIIGELPIPVPPIDLQKKFVALLEQTDKSKIPCEMEVAA